MTRFIATALALVMWAGLPAAAEEPADPAAGEPAEAGATDAGEPAAAFAPPILGAPDRRVGAGSRELAPSAAPCGETAIAATPDAESETAASCDEAGEDDESGESGADGTPGAQ